MIEINLTIVFHKLPQGCMTDQLQDTVCYATLIDVIKNFCRTKSFHLVEHLAYQLYKLVKQTITSANIRLQIKKKPNIENLGCCVFELNDGAAGQ
jgi:dihydroneopterin aldolase